MTTLKSRAIYKYKETCGMKISYRTHPILEKLHNKKLGKLDVAQEEYEKLSEISPILRERFETFSQANFKTYCFSKSFIDAFNSAGHKLIHSSLWKEIENGDYCFLYNDFGVAFSIKNDTNIGAIECETVGIGKWKMQEIGSAPRDATMLSHFGSIIMFYDIDNNDNGQFRTYGFAGYENSFNEDKFDTELLLRISSYFTLLLFIKYAEVETKYLPAGQKTQGIDCKYINETKLNVTYVDSLWFTNLVKSDAFKVRGHFRLQPKKKDGQWTKELIWINEFQKEGYTRRAGKVIAGEDGEQWNMAAPPDHSGNWQQATD